MKIECKLKREGGTVIDIDGIDYTFVPQADGAHVAEVTKEAHIERLLGISDAYCIYRGKSSKAAAPAVTPEEPVVVTATEETDAEETDSDEPVSLKDAYKAKFGHLPHHKWSDETIKSKLAE